MKSRRCGGSRNKKTTTSASVLTSFEFENLPPSEEKKRGPGRPPKSPNLPPSEKEENVRGPTVQKKRGRPPGSRNKKTVSFSPPLLDAQPIPQPSSQPTDRFPSSPSPSPSPPSFEKENEKSPDDGIASAPQDFHIVPLASESEKSFSDDEGARSADAIPVEAEIDDGDESTEIPLDSASLKDHYDDIHNMPLVHFLVVNANTMIDTKRGVQIKVDKTGKKTEGRMSRPRPSLKNEKKRQRGCMVIAAIEYFLEIKVDGFLSRVVSAALS